MDSKAANEFIRKNWERLDDRDLASALGISPNAVEHRRRDMGLYRSAAYGGAADQVLRDIEERKRREGDRTLRRKYEEILSRVEEAERERDAAIAIGEGISTYSIRPRRRRGREVVAVVLASDWHVEEEVKGKKVNFKNEYTLEVARTRAEEFFSEAARLFKSFSRDVPIETLVLALLGDFISGNIHDELLESCQLRPIEATIFAQRLIASGIEHLLRETGADIVVPCHVGNHGRITKKVHVSTEEGNSLEFYMYHVLADHFKGERRVKFLISDSYHSYLDVLGYTVRFHHGHSIKYGGGVGGLTVPAYRIIGRWNKTRPADIDCFGHHHTQFDGNSFLANGSQIGYSPYGLSVGGAFDIPKQTFFLIERGIGKTVVAPITYSR